MKKNLKLICAFMAFFMMNGILAQEITQTIRGTVIDLDTKTQLIGANVIVIGSDPIIGAITDLDGNFRMERIPLGRFDLKVSFLGYEDRTVPNVLVGAGKEIVLKIELIESVTRMEEVIVLGQQNKQEVLNDMALISARTFSVEETKRYAGAIDDPARMVSSFAGININAEGNNDIVVRGNSPKGVLWRLDGIEIPNPNHFADEGSTGGPINALNSAMLGNSDFFTGAFSPEYGNAISGVFDMKLRNGNNEKREYSLTASVLGLDATVEGPFKKGYSGSYLANYRYSTLSLLDQAGLVDFDGIPTYQDGSFKVILPAGKSHVFSIFGLGGKSNIAQEEVDVENKEMILWKAEAKAGLGFAGLSHTYLINDKTYLKSYVSGATTKLESDYFIPDESNNLYNVFNNDFIKTDFKVASTLNFKGNAKNKFKAGFIFSRLGYDMKANDWSFETDRLEPTVDQKGNSYAFQSFISWKYRFNEELSMVSGLHYLHFLLNNSISIEPRLAFKWQFLNNQSIDAGFGIHSKTESIAIYLAEQQQPDGSFINPNTALGLGKAAHFVVGYENMLSPNTHLKVEAYYQHLYDVPVENKTGSTYSLLNQQSGYTNRTLINDGTGTNYGMELTVERFFSKGFYYMSTVSLYRSLYTAIDGVERKSAFDGNYVFNLLGGKEFKIGKTEKNRIFFINAKIALIGGSRYTPIDLEASIEKGDVVRDDANPFSAKGDDIFKADLALGLRRNKKRITTEIKIDIQNITNNQAVVNEYYEHATESIITSYQLPLLPVLSYQINF